MKRKILHIALLTCLGCCTIGRGDLLPVTCQVQQYTLDRWLISYERYETVLADVGTVGSASERELFAYGIRHDLFYPQWAVVLHPEPSSQSIPLLRSTLRLPIPGLDRSPAPSAATPAWNSPVGSGIQFAWASGGLFYPTAFCVSAPLTVSTTSTHASFPNPEPSSILLLALGAILCRKRRRGA